MVIVAFVLGILVAQKSLGGGLVVLYTLCVYALCCDRDVPLFGNIPSNFILTGTLGYKLFAHVRVRVMVCMNPCRILGTGLCNGIVASTVPVANKRNILSCF